MFFLFNPVSDDRRSGAVAFVEGFLVSDIDHIRKGSPPGWDAEPLDRLYCACTHPRRVRFDVYVKHPRTLVLSPRARGVFGSVRLDRHHASELLFVTMSGKPIAEAPYALLAFGRGPDCLDLGASDWLQYRDPYQNGAPRWRDDGRPHVGVVRRPVLAVEDGAPDLFFPGDFFPDPPVVSNRLAALIREHRLVGAEPVEPDGYFRRADVAGLLTSKVQAQEALRRRASEEG